MTRSPDQTFKAAAHDFLIEQVRSPHDGLESVGPQAPEIDRRRGLRTGVASVVVLAALAAAWFGITALVSHRPVSRPAVSPAVSSAAPAPSRTVEAIIAPLAEVVGSGRFEGRASGDFTITQIDGGPEMRLTDFDSGGIKEMQVLLAVDLDSAACRADHVGYLAGTVTDAKTQTVVLQDSSPQRYSDLSYIHAVGLWPEAGCSGSQTNVTAAPVTWKVPSALRELASTNTGTRSGANGATQERNGRPWRYTVAAGDRIDAVAARFDVTPDELLYLNPLRRRGDSTTLFAGEQLNLDQTDRDWFWR